jgi:hypothetical protein
MAKVVECLPGKWKAQSLNPSTSKKKKKKKRKKKKGRMGHALTFKYEY